MLDLIVRRARVDGEAGEAGEAGELRDIGIAGERIAPSADDDARAELDAGVIGAGSLTAGRARLLLMLLLARGDDPRAGFEDALGTLGCSI